MEVTVSPSRNSRCGFGVAKSTFKSYDPRTRSKSDFESGAPAVSHGVAEEGSPRREAWGKMRYRQKSRQGRQNSGPRGFSFAATRLDWLTTQPTADAVLFV